MTVGPPELECCLLLRLSPFLLTVTSTRRLRQALHIPNTTEIDKRYDRKGWTCMVHLSPSTGRPCAASLMSACITFQNSLLLCGNCGRDIKEIAMGDHGTPWNKMEHRLSIALSF